ncbi:MAG: response regulator [Gammaproteobacteria bacterium]
MKLDPGKPAWPRAIVKLISTLCILVASATLIGWLFHYWISDAYLSYVLSIKPNTAICFILLSIILWINTDVTEKHTYIKSVSEILAAGVFLVGFLTLFEYFFNIKLGIDQFIFNDPSGLGLIPFSPGRMTPLVAINLVLLSLSLFFIDNKIINYRIYSWFILVVICTSMFEFLYHIYSYAYGNVKIIDLTQTTVVSSFIFIILSIGIFFIRPHRGFMKVLISENNSGRLARRLIPPVIIFPIIIGYIFLSEKAEYRSIFNVASGVLITTIIVTAIILINSYFVNKKETYDKKHAEDLKEFQTLALKSADAGTWIWNIPKNHMICDSHLHDLFGIKIGHFPPNFDFFFNFIHPDDRKRVEDELKFSLDKSAEFESQFRVYHPDQSIRYLATRGHIFRNNLGQPMKMAGICWDVTQRILAEQELRKAKETAEQLAEKAEEANRAKSAFLATMSHEIRTPLNGVMTTLELLYDTALTQEQCEYIATARKSSEDLLTVINDIIDYSRIESGHLDIEFTDFNLQSLIDDAFEKLVSQIMDKGISIDAEIDPNIPAWVGGDASRIRQVLTNLLNNAAKFTEKGEICLKIKLLSPATKNEKANIEEYPLLFEITDTGIGISPEIRTRLFKPFSQGDFSSSRKHGGTGLGLVICKRLIEALGGTIGFESSPGVGSNFWFKLNLSSPSSPVVESQMKIDPLYQHEKILCVDDNPVSCEIMKRQIKSWNLACDVCTNAGEALSMLLKASEKKEAYTLVIIDYHMPGMNGIELIKIIRRLDEINKTNVIILAPSGAGFGLEEMKKLQILMCLTKPLRHTNLYNGLMTAFQMIYSQGEHGSIVENQEKTNKDITILLAEDNATNQLVALKILKKLGYSADAVKNGREVLDAIKKKHYDLILMDCQMPELDGYSATEEIRKMEQTTDEHIFIIAMTAHALKGDRQKCQNSGMDDYIAKPIEISELASLLQRWGGKIKYPSAQKSDITQNAPVATEISSIIDMNRIHEIFGDDNQSIQEFLVQFQDSTSELMVELKAAIKNCNAASAKELFHKLKGSAGNSGVMSIHGLCVKAEEKVQTNEWSSVEKLYEQIYQLFLQMKEEINNLNEV